METAAMTVHNARRYILLSHAEEVGATSDDRFDVDSGTRSNISKSITSTSFSTRL